MEETTTDIIFGDVVEFKLVQGSDTKLVQFLVLDTTPDRCTGVELNSICDWDVAKDICTKIDPHTLGYSHGVKDLLPNNPYFLNTSNHLEYEEGYEEGDRNH